MNDKKGIAFFLGKLLAHIQSLIDDLLSFLFRRLKKKDEQSVSQTFAEQKGVFQKTGWLIKKIFGFLGKAGNSFFENYEEIRANKSKNKK